MIWILVLVLGALGVGIRFYLDQRLSQLNSLWPFLTFGINILGCVIAGAVLGSTLLRGQTMSPLQTALVIGFCGGFTTYSTFSLQCFQLIQMGNWKQALIYLSLTPILCLLSTAAAAYGTRALLLAGH